MRTVKLDHFPNFRDENDKNIWVATTQYWYFWMVGIFYGLGVNPYHDCFLHHLHDVVFSRQEPRNPIPTGSWFVSSVDARTLPFFRKQPSKSPSKITNHHLRRRLPSTIEFPQKKLGASMIHVFFLNRHLVIVPDMVHVVLNHNTMR